MKLRYYLRGLGIGMIVTALLMGVALKDGQPLSDAEIRAKAIELGMVEGDSRTLADLQGSPEPMKTPEPADISDPAEASEPADAADLTTASEPADASDSAEASEPADASGPTAAPEAAATPTPTPEQPESVTIVVSSGESSYTVSKSLADAGLVEDARDFDRYLVDNGYSKRISTGTYEISVGSTQEEIAKIITRSR